MAQRICSVPECGKPHKARGYCRTHYSRWQRHGAVDYPAPRKPGRRITKRGYVQIRLPWGHPLAGLDGWAYEHRVVVHESGRVLLAGEHVHHINGDKSDNRLENLSVLNATEHAMHHHPRRDRLACQKCGANDWYSHPSGYRRCRECRRRHLDANVRGLSGGG